MKKTARDLISCVSLKNTGKREEHIEQATIRISNWIPTHRKQTEPLSILGPVKTRIAARAIYLPVRVKEAPLVIRAIDTGSSSRGSNFDPYGLAFCMKEGHPLEAKVLEDGSQKVLAELQLKNIDLHATRHTFAIEVLQKTTDIITASEILGHAKSSTTLDMYGHMLICK